MSITDREISRRAFLKTGAATAAAASLDITACAASEGDQSAAPITPVRQTQYGAVRGADNGDYLVWYSVPYGAAPIGELRWRAPEACVAWSGVRDCSAFGAMAYQYGSGVIGTEDCLKLDIYSASNAHKRPVLVYLHGGNNQTGSTGELPGADLVTKDECVFVSIDHRLGFFGFNCLPALREKPDDTGNFALLDIARALDWVRDNIAAFGGDPNNITVSGFSAGGRDVMAMLASPLFAGRFHRAISFSGGMTIADEAASERQIAAAIAPLAVEDGLFTSEDAAMEWLLTSGKDVRDWLYDLDSERLCPLMRKAHIRMSVFPHLYGDDVVLPKGGFASAQYSSVPVLMLTGVTEFSMFAARESYFDSDEMKGYTEAETAAAKQFAVTYGSDMYRIFNSQCSAETMSPNYSANIYLCQIDYGAPSSRTVLPTLGSFHGVFLPMLSSVNDYTVIADFSGEGYQAMADIFNAYLRNFLAGGDPNDGALPEWKSWTPGNKLSMVLDGGDSGACAECRDVSTSYSAIMDRMDADTTVSPELKAKMIAHVLNGRWFSAELDARYGNGSLWK